MQKNLRATAENSRRRRRLFRDAGKTFAHVQRSFSVVLRGKISQEVTWGRADAKEIDINSKISGRVVKLLVEEGDAVQAGQVIAQIDGRDLDAQKLQLEANIAAIQAQQVEAAALTEMQRDTTQSALAQAKFAEEKARAD